MTGEKSPVRAYFFALLMTASAVGVRLLLDPLLGDRFPLVTLFAAVAAIVWYGGYRPAVLAAVLGFLMSDYLFIEPRGYFSFHRNLPDLIGALAYAASSSILIGFGEALRRSEGRAKAQAARYQTTLRSIGDAVIATDTAGRIVTMNNKAERLTGWTQSATSGELLDTVFRIVNEDTRMGVENPATRALREGSVVELNDAILIAKDGAETPIDDSAAPIQDDLGRIIGCVLVFRDITMRQRAEKALRRSERQLTDFFANANVGIHSVGLDGRILQVNQAEVDLLGYSAEELVGSSIVDVHVDHAVLNDLLARVIAGESVSAYPAQPSSATKMAPFAMC